MGNFPSSDRLHGDDVVGPSTQMVSKNHYDVLGVARGASASEIKAAHRARIKKAHPDAGTHADGAEARAINEAYDVLGTPSHRKIYDALLTTYSPVRTTSATSSESSDVLSVRDEGWVSNLPVPSVGGVGAVSSFSQEDPSRLAGYNVFDREQFCPEDMEWYSRDVGSRVTVTGGGRVRFRKGKDHVLSRGDARKYTVWGQFGSDPEGAQRMSGDRSNDLNTFGRIMTGQLLKTFTKIPAARIVHRPFLSDQLAVDVDHAAVCGDRLAVIQSQHLPSGDFFWLGQTLFHARDEQELAIVTATFPGVVEKYRQNFPGLQVRGWYVLHSSDGGMIRTNNKDAGNKPHVATPQLFLRELGDWLLAGERSHVVDRRTLSKLVLGYP